MTFNKYVDQQWKKYFIANCNQALKYFKIQGYTVKNRIVGIPFTKSAFDIKSYTPILKCFLVCLKISGVFAMPLAFLALIGWFMHIFICDWLSFYCNFVMNLLVYYKQWLVLVTFILLFPWLITLFSYLHTHNKILLSLSTYCTQVLNFLLYIFHTRCSKKMNKNVQSHRAQQFVFNLKVPT